MNAKITQGKRQLWQWDTGVQLMLFDIGTANEVHFATPDGVIRRDIVNNMCNIPDVVLQRAGTMVCYVFNREPYEGDTRHEFHFDVLPRPKPADYIDPPDEADYIEQIAERAAKAVPLFVVNVELVDGVLRADKLPWEIDAAADKGHACVMVYASNTLAYCGRKEKHPAFIGQPAKKTNGMFYVDVAYVLDDGTVDITPSSYIAAMTAKPLVFKGAVNATFTGTETTYVTIPDGGVSQEEIDEAVDKALTEAKDSGEFDGASGKDGKDGVDGKDGKDGKDGISVTITNITQSTEDDGYSVVTFSDGKQLRVKNGSKGSPGEGGSGGGGGVMTVVCTPTEDGTSFTADKSFEEIGDALLRGQAVQAYVQGLNAVAQMFMFSDNMVVFSAVASLMGDNAAVTLMMMKDGTNTMSVTSLGGTCIVNISTGDGVNGTADMTGPELFEAASMGQPVYANFNGGMYAPAQLIDSTYAVFRIEIPGGVIMATIDEQGAVAIELSEGGSAGGGGGNVVAVTLTPDGNTLKPSHTSSEIYNLVKAGNTVLLQYGIVTCTAKLIGESKCVFEHMGYSAAGDQMTFGDYMTITIAEDIVTLKDHMSQHQYPNPHPLVINGVSYDGSKYVTADTPIATRETLGGVKVGDGLTVDETGVLGVKPEGVLELIETITIMEETHVIERTAWPDGTPYDLTATIVDFFTKPSGIANSHMKMEYKYKGDNYYNYMNLIDAFIHKDKEQRVYERMYKWGGFWHCDGYSPYASYSTAYYQYALRPNNICLVPASKNIVALRFTVNSDSINFMPGSVIKIWGVRADA